MADSTKNMAILILAAGASSRMGQIKQLLPYKDTTLLGNAIQTAKAADSQAVFVVLGANAAVIRKKIETENIEVITNADWEVGLGSSVAKGMEFILKKEMDLDGVLIMLADQPLIDVPYINRLIVSFYNSPENVVATAYKRRAGVPAIFGQKYFKQLVKLTEDYGAKEIIAENKSDVLALDPEKKSMDIDTKTEYLNLIKKTK